MRPLEAAQLRALGLVERVRCAEFLYECTRLVTPTISKGTIYVPLPSRFAIPVGLTVTGDQESSHLVAHSAM